MSDRRAKPRLGVWVLAALLAIASVCVLTGLLPPPDAGVLAARVVPVLGFVAAITVVAELARDAAVFDVVAEQLARWGSGKVIVLWVLVMLLAVVSTVFLSLDTTAVILTPVVVLLAQSIAVPPLPFAMMTVWLANTASLLLPVSNLTNLLAVGSIGAHQMSFLALSWAPALVGIAVPVVILTVRYRRMLFGSYSVSPRRDSADPVLFWGTAVVLVVLLPLLAFAAEVWIPATAAAAIAVTLFALRRREALRLTLVPWRALGIAVSLFVIFETAHAQGLGGLLVSMTDDAQGVAGLLRVAGIGALGANGINNLPAYLVLEPAVSDDPVALMALLIGVNLGPLVSPWASLATLLWHQKATALGVTIGWGRFAVGGACAAIPTVALAVLALAFIAR